MYLPYQKKKALKEKPVTNKEVLRYKMLNLIASYKKLGHLSANLDPLKLNSNKIVKEIDPEFHGITQEDLNKEVNLKGILCDNPIKVYHAIEKLNEVYLGNVGFELEHVRSNEQRDWLYKEISKEVKFSKEEKIKILKEIVRTTRFEQFLHVKFSGAKRFSVEGSESSINSIEKVIDTSMQFGVKKIIIGMAHRGRLNVLTGVMGKAYHKVIAEFLGTPNTPESVTKCGDVKYHMGYSNFREINDNKINLSLAFNPSHLEAVNPVVSGRVKAKQNLFNDVNKSQVLPLLIHGDASFAGQGVVFENLMMGGLEGYNVGGTVHIIINNQIGFTANSNDSRSTTYASDIAKSISAPIFHINGDNVEEVVRITDIAIKYRQLFKKDVVLDIISYRKYGHNEGDEPRYTQPVMYDKIKNHNNLEKIYSDKLLLESVITQDLYNNIVKEMQNRLNSEFELAKNYIPKNADWLKEEWSKIRNDNITFDTSVSADILRSLGEKITQVPKNFNVNSKIIRQLEKKRQVIESQKNIDWGTAESLAFATLLNEGYPVRITGQDSGRGTFSHRHSVLHDSINGSKYEPLNNLDSKAAKYEVYDSILSEYAVLGFEYGYSLSYPFGLTIWEAQFGDFANGAQIIFDQFIASSEVKWLRKSNLVMLLPHGYEGQGPEHSSARLERYLQACADNNLYVVNLTTPANLFHCLRRQLHSSDRKPLVIMSPKSLLRNVNATSNLEEFTTNSKFNPIITDPIELSSMIKKVIFVQEKYIMIY